MKKLLLIFALTGSGLLWQGCNSEKISTGEQTSATVNAPADSTQLLAYVCPMRCEGSGSNQPGKCKVCDMDLVKNPEPHQDLVAPPAQ